jgi:hypothetical protein
MRHRAASALAFGLCVAAIGAHANPVSYSGRAIDARLADDASGEPVAEAVIVALWKLVPDFGRGAEHADETLRIVETASGRDGRFTFPAWGPLARPAGFHLEHHDPQLLILAAGYYPRQLSNEPRSRYDTSALRGSEWNGRVITLRRFSGQPQRYRQDNGRFRDEVEVTGTLDELAGKIGALQTSLGWHRYTDDWKAYPRMIRALARERDRLVAAGLAKAGLYIKPIASLWGGEGNVRAYLERSAP